MVKLQLQRLLDERGWNQAEFARRTGIRANTINDLYHGVAERVNFEHLDRMCEVLECPLDELIVRVPGKCVGNEYAKRKRRPHA